MFSSLKKLSAVFALSLFFGTAIAAPSTSLDHAEVKLITDIKNISSSSELHAGIHIQLEPGWHTYTDPSGDAGLPVALTWNLPEGFTAGGIEWPAHKTFNEQGITTYGYEDDVLLPVKITTPSTVGDANTLTVKVEMLVCKDICIPHTTEVSITLPKGAGDPSADAALFSTQKKIVPATNTPTTPAASQFTLLSALLFAFLGGIVLNIMPCVFPVLSLKVLSLSKQSTLTKKQMRAEGLAYTAGILVCFLTIASLLIALQQAGQAIGWGYQMQSPLFVSALIFLLFFIGLNLSGFFELPVLFGHLVGRQTMKHHSIGGSFFTGLLATFVATPCTAPFMAGAVGFALTQSEPVALLIFTALGLGLASPFLLFSFLPALAHKLPKPGAWMEHFRELLAFPIYASVVWLLWVLNAQVGGSGISYILFGMIGCVFALWLKRFFTFGSTRYALIALALIALSIAAAVNGVSKLSAPTTSAFASHGEPYTAARLAELRKEGKAVFIDATATWCITCQVNWQLALGRDAVQSEFKKRGVVFLVADWTNKNEEVTKLLRSFAFSGVPMYAYFPPNGGEPKILPQILTTQIILETIQ